MRCVDAKFSNKTQITMRFSSAKTKRRLRFDCTTAGCCLENWASYSSVLPGLFVVLGQTSVCASPTGLWSNSIFLPRGLIRRLLSFSIQADINVLGLASTLGEFSAPAVKGMMTADEALELLLSGSGLEYRYSGLAIVVRSCGAGSPPSPPPADRNIERRPQRRRWRTPTTTWFSRKSLSPRTGARRIYRIIPIAVSALQAADLSRNHIRDLREISQRLVPGSGNDRYRASQAAVLGAVARCWHHEYH